MPLERSIRVLVVDDHAGIRIGISSLINAERPRMVTVGTASTAADALAQSFALQPDVIVLDVNLDGEDGLSLIPALQRATVCDVVVLTSLADPNVARYAKRMGASACVHKAAPASELLRLIGAFRADDFVGAPANAGVVVSHAAGNEHP